MTEYPQIDSVRLQNAPVSSIPSPVPPTLTCIFSCDGFKIVLEHPSEATRVLELILELLISGTSGEALGKASKDGEVILEIRTWLL